MRRRAILLRGLPVALALCGCGGSGSTAPDLLWVVFDTTRADHLSCYGYGRETTPTVDALAARGLRMENAFAHSSLTPISAASFLTGRLPVDHEIRSLFMVGEERLAADTPTFFEHLWAEGYATGGFVSAPPMGSRYGFERGYDRFDDRVDRKSVARGGGNAYQRRGDATTEAALAWLGEVGPNRSQPIGTFVHFFDAHDAALVPPRKFLKDWMSTEIPRDLDRRGHWRDLAEPAHRIELYDAELRFQDDQVARLLGELEGHDRLDDTLVCFLADHGEGLGDHGFWTHGLLYQEQLRVPWVLAGPGVPPGVVQARVRLVDVVPTLGALMGLATVRDRAVEGESILPLLHGGGGPARNLYAEVRHAPGDSLGRDQRMFSRTLGDWKYIHRPEAASELYDLVTDPAEERNVVAENPDVVEALDELLIPQMDAGQRSFHELSDLSPETLEMLRELGYL